MSSPLHNKINSYAIEKGIEFGTDNSLPRLETGSFPQSVTSQWFTFSTNNSTPSPDGPGGGNYSHNFYYNTGRRYRKLYSTNPADWYSVINDGDYTVGIWVKINPYTYTQATGVLLMGNVLATSRGGWSLNFVTNGAGFEPLSQIVVNFPISSTQLGTAVLFDGVNTNNYAEIDRWYYIVIRRTNNTNMEIYLDGVLKHSITGIFVNTATDPLGFQFGSPNIGGSAPDRFSVNISNFHLSTSSVIGPTEIAEIWNVGKSISDPVYYSDAGQWITNDLGPNFQPFVVRRKLKRWNGNTWHEINGQYWNGTNWEYL